MAILIYLIHEGNDRHPYVVIISNKFVGLRIYEMLQKMRGMFSEQFDAKIFIFKFTPKANTSSCVSTSLNSQ
jgi:hypothetical protein